MLSCTGYGYLRDHAKTHKACVYIPALQLGDLVPTAVWASGLMVAHSYKIEWQPETCSLSNAKFALG